MFGHVLEKYAAYADSATISQVNPRAEEPLLQQPCAQESIKWSQRLSVLTCLEVDDGFRESGSNQLLYKPKENEQI